jgi:hypothetical protein
MKEILKKVTEGLDLNILKNMKMKNNLSFS